jgi:hypothetical protein
MTRFADLLKRIFTRPPGVPDPGALPSEAEARAILSGLDQTREVEYSCEEVFALLDEYAEMVANGQDASGLMPLVKLHLEICPDCAEEYQALLRILRSSAAR